MLPHRQQPIRLPRPWDSPGKNTGVSCHFLLQCMKVKMKVKSLSCVQLLATPWTAAYQAPPRGDCKRYCGRCLPSSGETTKIRESKCSRNYTHPKKKVKSLSSVWLFVTQWTVAYRAPPSMEFSRQEHWSGLPFLPPGDIPNSWIKPRSPTLQTDSTVWATRKSL